MPGGLIDLAAALIIMMIIPVNWALSTQDGLRIRYAAAVTAEFVEDTCHHGCISRDRYEAYLYRLSQIKCAGSFEMKCRTFVYEPVYEDGVFSGRTVFFESCIDHDTILDSVYGPSGCCFDSESVFEVTVAYHGHIIEISNIVSGNVY